jgi:hypothetical protein
MMTKGIRPIFSPQSHLAPVPRALGQLSAYADDDEEGAVGQPMPAQPDLSADNASSHENQAAPEIDPEESHSGRWTFSCRRVSTLSVFIPLCICSPSA